MELRLEISEIQRSGGWKEAYRAVKCLNNKKENLEGNLKNVASWKPRKESISEKKGKLRVSNAAEVS